MGEHRQHDLYVLLLSPLMAPPKKQNGASLHTKKLARPFTRHPPLVTHPSTTAISYPRLIHVSPPSCHRIRAWGVPLLEPIREHEE